MTPEEIKRLKELCERTPPPPWKFYEGDDFDHWELWSALSGEYMVQDDSGVPPANEFITFCIAARIAMPKLIVEVERLQGIEDVLNDKIFEIEQSIGRYWEEIYLDKLEKAEHLSKQKLAIAKEALEQVCNNIGVPQPGYPAPFKYAYDYAKEALEKIK